MTAGVFSTAAACLFESDPARKCRAVDALGSAIESGDLIWDEECLFDPDRPPGRPDRPELVDGTQVPRRRLGSVSGRAALVHAVAHIEFNAINLALDAVCRFRDMPREYVLDWISVAVDEARHFRLLQDRLQELGFEYGEFAAHNGLWEMCEKTAHDCLVRMALVPRVLEARGLDVTPGMIQRLLNAGDRRTVACLEIILDEEVRHVAIGSRWYRHLCELRRLDPEPLFVQLLDEYYSGRLKGPFNRDARLKAGFSQSEMQALEAL